MTASELFGKPRHLTSVISVFGLILLCRWPRTLVTCARWRIANFAASPESDWTAACRTIVHDLVMSRLDYCNAILYGLPDAQLRKLQLVQNSAARLVTGTRRREHITPVLFALHWLPIRQRIQFKYVCLSVSQRSQTTGRNSCSIVSGDVSN